MAKVARKATKVTSKAIRKGKPRAMTAKRAANIKRWQQLGAAARRGSGKANKQIHHSQTAKSRRKVVSSYANAAKWGVQKLVMPVGGSGLIAFGKNALPGYNAFQVGRTAAKSATRRTRHF